MFWQGLPASRGHSITSSTGRADVDMNWAIACATDRLLYASSPTTSGCERPFAVSVWSTASSTAKVPSNVNGGWMSK